MKKPGQKDAGVAIVGVSCRFPGAADHRRFWRNLASETNSVIETPPDRWPADKFYSPDASAPGKSASKWGGFLENIDEFDTRFFNISPCEARSMDPQQRLLLQEVWRCLEDAGVSPERVAGTKTGVYVGAMSVDYHHDMAAPGSPTDAHGCSGNYSCMLSNRVSHFFGFRGPSLTIDTACSSSLAAMDAARRALESGEIEFAVVGGVSLNFNPWKYISLSKARMLSPDGQCKAFDRDANGYVPGEGIGALLLRTVHAAKAEGNHIYGVLQGSAVNHGGRAVSLTAPVVEAQRDVVLAAWDSAGLSMETCTYLEAHGTGTSLGDPIEVEALTQAFRRFTPDNQFCLIGSVKTNIGHLEAAAGIAGVVKVLMMMDARQIPATLNIRAVNPLIAFEKTPFEPCRSLTAWETRPGTPLRAGVSSFGFGGVNGHVVIESFDERTDLEATASDDSGDGEPSLFLLSAKTAPSLHKLIEEWVEFAGSAPFVRHSLSDVCGTLQNGRTHFGARFAAILRRPEELPELLRSHKIVPPNTKPLPLALVFGAAEPSFSPGMEEWLRGDKVFEDAWGLCAAAARDEAGIELGLPWDQAPRNAPPEVAPARAFALQYATGAKLIDLLPGPVVISGGGTGFWTALAICGMAGCREALSVLLDRRLAAMVKLNAPRLPFHDPARECRVERFLVPPACLQNLLGAQSADEAEFQAVLEHARALVSGPFTFRKNLESWNAYLGPEVSDALTLLADGGSTTMRRRLLWVVVSDSLRKLNRKWNLVETLTLPFVEENELLDLLDDGVIEPGDLAELLKYPDNTALLETVSARSSAKSVRIDPAKPYRILRSFNPDGGNGEYTDGRSATQSAIPSQDFFRSHTVVLVGGSSQTDGARSPGEIGLPSMGRTDFLTCLKQVWEKGLDVRWDRLPAQPIRKVSLPGYQFIGEKFWIRDKGATAPTRQPRTARTPGRMVRVFDPAVQDVIRDHRIGGRRLLPAASMMLLALEIARADLETDDAPVLTRVEIKRPGITEGLLAVEASLDADSGEFKIEAAGALLCHGKAGSLEVETGPKLDFAPWLQIPDADAAGLHADFQQRNYDYGPSLRILGGYKKGFDEILFSFTPGEDRGDQGLETAILDGALQAVIVAARIFGLAGGALLLPCGFERLGLGANFSLSRRALVHRRSFLTDQSGIRASIELFEETGIRTAVVEGALFKATLAVGAATKTAFPASNPGEEPKSETAAPAVETIRFSDSIAGDAGADLALSQESNVPENAQNLTAEIESVRGSLAELLASVLQVKPQDIDAETDLREYGLDSVSLTEYAESIEQRLNLSVNPTLLFEHPTLRDLAGHLVNERAAAAARSEQNRRARISPSPAPSESRPAQPVTPKATAPPPPRLPAPAVAQVKVETRPPVPTAPVAVPPTPSRPPTVPKAGVAIIGMAGRFPECPDISTFWSKLEACEDLVTEVPADRWDWRKHFGDPHKEPNKTLSKWGGFLSDIDKFDAAFFRISPKEAAAMDPQQRILLELAWKTIEDSGQRPSALAGSKTGVFVGVCNDDYRELLEQRGMPIEAQTTTGSCFSIVPNRVSFVFDFHGPSVAVDTACSSSLVAMHQAVQAIESGDCDMALAGGVNICCMPRRQISLGHGGMLAADGKCRTFDESASGYVRGEGAALVMLKPLDKALADGDPIYAVVKGTAVNHGGSANSLTAPNPNAQAELIKTAFLRAGFEPATVGFIETHGTGTALGDPIEIAALKKAFAEAGGNLAKPAPEAPFCGLGSLKTNIGHSESAAGVAGVVKTALALRHGRLPGTVHFRKLNSRIELENSPFYIVEKTIAWPARWDADGRPLPRRAGVSSFGFGGVNAHVALEEFPQESRPGRPTSGRGPAIFTFSAKTAEGLKAQASSFADWLKSLPGNEPNLDETAWTLQTGREAFEHRLAVLAQSKAELLKGLEGFLQGALNDGWIVGSPGGKGNSSSLGDGPEDQEFFKRLTEAGKMARLGRFWAEGAVVRWFDLWPDPKPRRVSLPTYPFARDRHWVDRAAKTTTSHAGHPAGSTNGPFDARERNHAVGSIFQKAIGATEPVLRDHIVLGRPILPGMAILEEARSAVEMATGRAPTRLVNALWLKPLGIQGDSCQFRIVLQNAAGGTGFEIWSGSPATEAPHASGKFLFEAKGTPPIEDLEAIHNRCGQSARSSAIYDSFESCHLTYGPYFKGLQEVRTNVEEFLARIEFSAGSLSGEGAMPPRVLDSAAQGALKWIFDQGEGGLYVPYSLDEAAIYAKPESVVFAHGRVLQFDSKAGVARFHILIVDESGKPLVEMTNFCARRLQKEGRNGHQAGSPVGLSLMRPVWRAVTPVGSNREVTGPRRTLIFGHADDFGLGNQLAATLEAGDCMVVELGGRYARTGEARLSIDERSQADFERAFAEMGPVQRVLFLGGADARSLQDADQLDHATLDERSVLALLRLLKALAAQERHGTRVELRVLVANSAHVVANDEGLSPWAAATVALSLAAAKEFPELDIRVVDFDGRELIDPRKAIAATLNASLPGGTGVVLSLRGGKFFRRVLQPIALDENPGERLPLREAGVWLIVGGAGGLGFETAKLLAREYRAKLVLTGRRPVNAEIRRQIEELFSLGGEAIYCAGDATDAARMKDIVAEGRAQFGGFHGAIYSALVLRDLPIRQMDEAAFRAAFDPKAGGITALQEALDGEALDLLLVYSSANSFLANAGQANYAAGCAFNDASALRWAARRGIPTRIINWGFWGDTGAVARGGHQERLAKQGIFPITNAEGISALRNVISSPIQQLVAAKLSGAALEAIGFETQRECRVLAPSNPSLADILSVGTRAGGVPKPLISFAAFFQRLEEIVARRLLIVFQAAGFLAEKQEVRRILELRAAMGVQPIFHPVFDALLNVLAKAGLVTVSGGLIAPTEKAANAAPDKLTREIEDFRRTFPDAKPYLALLDACLERIPAVLRGEIGPLEVLFPNGSGSLVEAIYGNNAISDYFNALVAASIESLLEAREHRAGNRQLRILEIGAGVGGTTAVVARAIAKRGGAVDYTFTDLSPSLAQAAHTSFGDRYPWMRFATLNIEENPKPQGFEPGDYDIVLATNVLHATRDLGGTLRQVKSLLRRNGLLILNEATRSQPYLTTTFGLLEGWWRGTDLDSRISHSPLAKSSVWKSLLRQAGFRVVSATGDPEVADLDHSCQTVFVAESDGVIEGEVAQHHSNPPENSQSKTESSRMTKPVAPSEAGTERALWVDLEARLARLVADATGVAPTDIDADASFVDLGIDSIIGIGIINRINHELGLSLKATALFNYTCLAGLAGHIETLPCHSPAADNTKHREHAAPPAPPVERAVNSTSLAQAISAETNGVCAGHGASEPDRVAVIGMACRFAGANNLDEFWKNLAAGVCSVHEAPLSRWGHPKDYYDTDRHQPGKSYGKAGGFLEGIEFFDPLFFDLSPAEAELMDPQQRLFLEECWKAIEDAGYSSEQLAGRRCGVFAGVSKGDYFSKMRENGVELDARTLLGNETSIMTGRIAYHLNLKGPAMAVDTACSSSLVATHLACRSILSGECDMALACGVFIMTTPRFHIETSKTLMLSPKGLCKTFDQGADGFVPGEGVAALVLKSLKKALEDGDQIHGVIAASAVNQDGRSNGIMAPNSFSQRNLIAEVHQAARLNPETITMAEAHGTGTQLGDPIEVEALTAAFRLGTDKSQFCALGSVKTNIGHTAPAAGLAGVLKVLLALRHGQIPPSLHFESANPHIDFAPTPFFVNTRLTPWEKPASSPRRGCVSSFGFSGTNAHLILEEGPAVLRRLGQPRSFNLFCLSGKTREALTRRALDLVGWLKEKKAESRLASNGSQHAAWFESDLSFTLNSGRSHFEWRLAAIASDAQELEQRLTEWLDVGTAEGIVATSTASKETPQVNQEAVRLMAAWNPSHWENPPALERYLGSLAEIYCRRGEINWEVLYRGESRRRISAPTYPFERYRCWPWPEAAVVNHAAANPRPANLAPKKPRSQMLLTKIWSSRQLSPGAADTSLLPQLLICEEAAVGARVAAELRHQSGGTWIAIFNQDKSRRISEHEYAFPFSNPAEAVWLSKELAKNYPRIGGLAHLAISAGASNADERAPMGLIALYQQALETWGPQDFHLLHMTQGLREFKNPRPCLAGSVLAGFVRTLGAEHRGLRARSVDLDPAVSDLGAWASVILLEASSADPAGEVCHRAGERYAASLDLIGDEGAPRVAWCLDPAKVYVITGGTGELGSEIAALLARKGAKKLLLLGKKPLPARGDWTGLAAEITPTSAGARVRRILRLEKLGASVETASVDLNNETALSALFAGIRKNFGPIGGVIHCAGTMGSTITPFMREEAAEIERTLAPKVGGVQTLARVLHSDPIDFFVLFSSVAGLIPGLGAGICDYAAANAFLDHFAIWQRSKGRRAFRSIVWPSWGETAMGKMPGANYLALGFQQLSTAEGLALLERAMSVEDNAVILPCSVDPTRFSLQNLMWRAESAVDSQAGTNSVETPITIAPLASDPNMGKARLLLTRLFSGELKIPENRIDPDCDFGRLGVDSVLLAGLVRRIEGMTGHPLEPSLLLEHPTINRLSARLAGDFPETAAPATTVERPSSPPEGTVEMPRANANSGRPDGFTGREIAVIGLACRFPGAEGGEEFWELLRSGRSTISEAPVNRWDTRRWYSPVPAPGKSVSKWGGFLDGMELFDAGYFGIDGDQARQMDPLARHFLEASVQAARNAGYSREDLWNSRTGVFVGTRTGSFANRLQEINKGTVVGIGQNFIAAQVAQHHHWRGPNLVIDTACSSSLAGLHFACQSLLAGDCDLALAGGVDLLLDEKIYLMLSEAKALSPDGKCHAFDAKANGYVPGEGCGAVMLKTLEMAVTDGDPILAVIRGSAINNDGHTMGITTPSLEAQEELIAEALKRSGVSAETITCVEAHGTGTMIGDPIELRALSRAFGTQTTDTQYCAIGSVKTNLGHLHSAAGIASFIKIVLALRHGLIPPTLNCETPNPRFDFANSPFYPSVGLRDWEPRGGSRRAGISSFGFGGTNCHVVLEEFSAGSFPGFIPRRKPLPPTQFDRKRYWPDAPETKNPDMEAETLFATADGESFLVLEEVLGS